MAIVFVSKEVLLCLTQEVFQMTSGDSCMGSFWLVGMPLTPTSLQYRFWTILHRFAPMTVAPHICWTETERFAVSICGILRIDG